MRASLTNSRCCLRAEHGWLRLFGGGLSYLEDLSCAASNGAVVFARQQLCNFIGHSPIVSSMTNVMCMDS